MGAGQSARKLTISNEDELGVILISSGVAERLAHGINNANKEGANSDVRPSGGLESTSSTVKHDNTQQTSHHIQHSAPAPISNYPVQHQQEYTMSALKMQQLKEEELGNQNLYWQKRLQNMKDNHAKIDRILEEEYQRAVDQVASAQGKKKIDVNSVVPPCIENKDKVLRCYQDNPKEILKCSSLVEEFSNCVDERRGRLIAARC